MAAPAIANFNGQKPMIDVSDTSRSGSGYASGRSITPLTTLKIAVIAPTPSAMVRTATAVNAGLRRSARSAKRRSAATLSRGLM